MSVEWKASKTSRKIGSKVVFDSEKGKEIRKPIVKKNVPYDYPDIWSASPEEFLQDIQLILDKKMAGYDTWPKLFAHFQYGAKRHVATLLNQGKDVRLSPAQLQALEMYVKLVNMPGSAMSREEAIRFLTVQGIENAAEAFDGFTEGESEDEPEDNA